MPYNHSAEGIKAAAGFCIHGRRGQKDCAECGGRGMCKQHPTRRARDCKVCKKQKEEAAATPPASLRSSSSASYTSFAATAPAVDFELSGGALGEEAVARQQLCPLLDLLLLHERLPSTRAMDDDMMPIMIPSTSNTLGVQLPLLFFCEEWTTTKPETAGGYI